MITGKYNVKCSIEDDVLIAAIHDNEQYIHDDRINNGRRGNGSTITDEDKERYRRDVLNEGKSTLVSHANCNKDLDKFITISTNMTNIVLVREVFSKFIVDVNKKLFRGKSDKLKYISTFEFTQKGFIHIHMLCNIPSIKATTLGTMLDHVYRINDMAKDIGLISGQVFRVNIKAVKEELNINGISSRHNIALYMTKNFKVKDKYDIEFIKAGKSRYSASKNLLKPRVITMLCEDDFIKEVSDYVEALKKTKKKEPMPKVPTTLSSMLNTDIELFNCSTTVTPSRGKVNHFIFKLN